MQSGWRSEIGFANLRVFIQMPNKKVQIDRLGDVLGTSLKRLDLSSRLEEYGVWPIWNDIVGKTIALNAQPEKIRNGTLFVKVSSPVWMQQLQFMKEMIADRLNRRLKAERVKNIFFIVGRIDPSSVLETETDASAPATSAPEIDDRFLESVNDPALRQAFKRLLQSYARHRRQE